MTEKQHAVLSPSGADNWSECHGALAACKGITRKRTSEAAARGTCKHELSEYILTGPYPTRGATFKVGQTMTADGFTFDVDDEFADHVETYCNYVNSRPGKKRFEVYLSADHIYGVPDQGGTADCIHLDYTAREIEVIDAKFGYIPVGAKHKQLRIYGATALALYDLEGDWDTVRTTIVQPQDFSEPVKTHVYTRAEIEAFIEEIRPIAQKVWTLYTSPLSQEMLLKHLTPSDTACAWCPMADVGCVARNSRIATMFDDNMSKNPDVALMTDAQLGELYPLLPDIAEWVKQITEEAQRRALNGTQVPGNKLIYGRKGRRAWSEESENAVILTLSMALGPDDMYQPRKLVSPTAAEDALKKANAKGLYASLAPFVTQSKALLKLVPNSTKGDAVTVAKVEFQDVSK